jgi:hypothetical protein
MTKLNSLTRARVIGPEGGTEDGAAGAGVGEGAAGVDVLMVSSSEGHETQRQLCRHWYGALLKVRLQRRVDEMRSLI